MTTDIDVLGERAARALHEVSPADVEARLSDLHRTRRRRARGRTTAVALVAVMAGVAAWGRGADRPAEQVATDTVPASVRAALGEDATVVDVARSPSGDRDVVAALRGELPSVVAVVPVGRSTATVVWSAPTPGESDARRLSWATAVAWAPDESRLAIVLATRTAGDGTGSAVRLTLVTVGPDGSGRELVGPVGRCACDGTTPDLVWPSPDEVEVRIPDGSDEGTVRRSVR
ncbi:hypothetical protein J2X46_002117 [Nocardioides sp. BE266]|uniref:hypothetical protein n=1 Tax=Nocardioides sp. BE266 TaxID=2817725 RepID=UPI00285792DC|nr:hypothetical protein [Nocardioides sp. BE266]MDR7253132.1 hypothetical protein [Nocardioides sp. BE266]